MTKNNKIFVYAFLLVSVLLWAAISDAWGYSKHLFASLPNDWNRYIYGYISRLIWAIPFLFLIIKEKHRETIQPEQVFGLHFHWKSFLTVFVLSTMFVLGKMFFTHGGWWINPNIIFLQELSKYLIVGFVEELVYCGFGLNMLSNKSIWPVAIIHFWYDFIHVLLIG